MNHEAVQCPKCGAEMFVGAHFCMRCGSQLSGSLPDVELDLADALGEPVENEQSSTKLRTAERAPADWAANLPRTAEPSAPPAPRAGADFAARSGSTQPLPIPPNARNSAPAKPPSAGKIPLPPLALAADFEPSPVAPSSPELGSGPRASARPSALPFMEALTSGSASTAASENSDNAGGAPGTMSEALARVSRLPDFSIDDIDDGFASIQDTTVKRTETAAPDSLADAYEEVQSLFADLVAAHLAPVRELLGELGTSGTERAVLELCRPVARALKSAAEQLPDQQLHRALCALSDALAAASSSGSAGIEEPARARLREAYAAVSQLLPSVNEQDPERARRELVIVQAIFECTSGLGRVQRDKLSAAGFTGLSMLCLANARELSEASGMPLELAERLVEQVERFKRAAAASASEASRDAQRQALDRLVLQLRDQNQAFETSRRGWSREDQENKRRVQRKREETLAQVNIVLAELGELPLIAQLEKLPFERKLSELERFLVPAQSDGLRFSQASGGQ
jgi:hypothetical protein